MRGWLNGCHTLNVRAAAILLLLATPAFALQHREARGAATLEVRTDPDAATLSLSDTVHVTITVDGSKELRVEAPVKLAAGAGWDVVTTAAEAKLQTNGRMRWQQTLTLAPAMPGELTLAMPPLIVHDGGEERIAFKPLTIAVHTQIKDPDLRTARDITATEELPALLPGAGLTWLWFAAVPVALAAGVGLWFVLGRRGPPRSSSPRQKALRECDRLVAMELPQKQNVKGFVVLLTGIVRRYLERRFDLPARRRTTAELLGDIDTCKQLDDDARRWLRGFLTEADRVKFAGAAIGAEECGKWLEEVRSFVSATSPTPVAERRQG
jgi:hypothetical protein